MLTAATVTSAKGRLYKLPAQKRYGQLHQRPRHTGGQSIFPDLCQKPEAEPTYEEVDDQCARDGQAGEHKVHQHQQARYMRRVIGPARRSTVRSGHALRNRKERGRTPEIVSEALSAPPPPKCCPCSNYAPAGVLGWHLYSSNVWRTARSSVILRGSFINSSVSCINKIANYSELACLLAQPYSCKQASGRARAMLGPHLR